MAGFLLSRTREIYNCLALGQSFNYKFYIMRQSKPFT